MNCTFIVFPSTSSIQKEYSWKHRFEKNRQRYLTEHFGKAYWKVGNFLAFRISTMAAGLYILFVVGICIGVFQLSLLISYLVESSLLLLLPAHRQTIINDRNDVELSRQQLSLLTTIRKDTILDHSQ